MLEVDKRVLLHAFVERAKVRGTETEGVAPGKVMEVPIDELPIESVVVGDKHHAALAVQFEPVGECRHDGLGFVKLEALLALEPTDL